ALKHPRPRLAEVREELRLNVERLQQCVVDFCACIDAVNARALRYVVLANRIANMPLVGPLLKEKGLENAFREGERLEQVFKLTGSTNEALASAVREGKSGELLIVIDRLGKLKELLNTIEPAKT